jgi:hypothetical protein
MIVPSQQIEMYPDMTTRERAQLAEAGRVLKEFADLAQATKADDIQVSGSHYKDMAVQPWAAMEAVLTREEFIGYLKGNVIKYTMRQGKKADSDDAGKARHYIKKLKEVQRGNP